MLPSTCGACDPCPDCEDESEEEDDEEPEEEDDEGGMARGARKHGPNDCGRAQSSCDGVRITTTQAPISECRGKHV